jgi:hypothetical protein
MRVEPLLSLQTQSDLGGGKRVVEYEIVERAVQNTFIRNAGLREGFFVGHLFLLPFVTS